MTSKLHFGITITIIIRYLRFHYSKLFCCSFESCFTYLMTSGASEARQSLLRLSQSTLELFCLPFSCKIQSCLLTSNSALPRPSSPRKSFNPCQEPRRSTAHSARSPRAGTQKPVVQFGERFFCTRDHLPASKLPGSQS